MPDQDILNALYSKQIKSLMRSCTIMMFATIGIIKLCGGNGYGLRNKTPQSSISAARKTLERLMEDLALYKHYEKLALYEELVEQA